MLLTIEHKVVTMLIYFKYHKRMLNILSSGMEIKINKHMNPLRHMHGHWQLRTIHERSPRSITGNINSWIPQQLPNTISHWSQLIKWHLGSPHICDSQKAPITEQLKWGGGEQCTVGEVNLLFLKRHWHPLKQTRMTMLESCIQTHKAQHQLDIST